MWESREGASQGFLSQLGEEHPDHSPPAYPSATIPDVETGPGSLALLPTRNFPRIKHDSTAQVGWLMLLHSWHGGGSTGAGGLETQNLTLEESVSQGCLLLFVPSSQGTSLTSI